METEFFSDTSRIKTIIYWTTTIITIAGMLLGGAAQLFRIEHEKQVFTDLGYPLYLLSILGVWEILGGIVLIIPGFPLLKVCAYAGLFFVTTSAALSHIANGNPKEVIPPIIVGIIAVTSFLLNPKLQGITSSL